MNIYKWFYMRLPWKRPLTYVWRDLWTQAEIMMQFLWFFTGIGIYIWLGWFGVMIWCIAYIYGYINGHFFWGTRHIKGQKGGQ